MTAHSQQLLRVMRLRVSRRRFIQMAGEVVLAAGAVIVADRAVGYYPLSRGAFYNTARN
jgi:nitroreductase